MKNYIICLGILVIISGKVDSYPVTFSHNDNTFKDPTTREAESINDKSTLSEKIHAPVGISNQEDKPSSSLVTFSKETISDRPQAWSTNQGSLGSKRRPKQDDEVVDGFEDAIKAALALSYDTTTTRRSSYSVKTKATILPSIVNDLNTEANLIPAPQQTIPPNYLVLSPEDLQLLMKQQQLAELGGITAVETTTREPAPGEYLAGLFGSLASANLLGIADNTFKLLATSQVQNFFVGLADQVTCQITNTCTSTNSQIPEVKKS